MKYARLSETTYVLRLERSEQVHETIQAFCRDNDLSNASISGIGSVENPTLAHYTIQTKEFTERSFSGVFEITSLLGNVALLKNMPMTHLHVTIAGPKMEAFGGHLVSGACSATLELFLRKYDTRLTKSYDEGVGLNVWDFEARP